MWWWIVLLVVVVLGVALVLWGITIYNKLIRGKNDCEEGFSTMDVYMKKRYDLVPNLVNTVKGYASHESKTLEAVVKARNICVDAKNAEEQMKGETMLTKSLRSIMMLTENYPDLKADKNFLDLQEQLKTLEEDIANSRKYYNAVVKNFNNTIEIFPSSIIAKMYKFVKKEMFIVDDVEERKAVKVEF